jgi:hypothetical protein
VFVVKMWRLLIYEVEAKKVGISKWIFLPDMENGKIREWIFNVFITQHIQE